MEELGMVGLFGVLAARIQLVPWREELKAVMLKYLPARSVDKVVETSPVKSRYERTHEATYYPATITLLKIDAPIQFGCPARAKVYRSLKATGMCAERVRPTMGQFERYRLFGSREVFRLIWEENARFVSCAMLPFNKTSKSIYLR
jgi:hypothetical protein